MLDNQGPSVVLAMRNIKFGVIENLDMTYPMVVDKRVDYMQSALSGTALKKYKKLLVGYKESVKGVAGYQWTLGVKMGVTMENFRSWVNNDAINGSGDMYLGRYRCINFDTEIWFDLGKIIWGKNRITFQDHIKYTHNDILKTFRVGIIQYAEQVRHMHYLAKYLPPT